LSPSRATLGLVSSRLALDAAGRRIAVVTAPAAGLEVGMRFVVLGDALKVAEPGFHFTGARTGRLASNDEKTAKPSRASVASRSPTRVAGRVPPACPDAAR
jgi:hypothetical protein